MKVRVISDLHLDVNREHPFSLEANDTFTVVLGDTSGDPNITIPWIRKNVRRGLVIAGNHIVYNNRGCSINYLRTQMHCAFKKGADVEFLEACDGKNFKRTVEGVLFLGSCLYTDNRYTNECDMPMSVERNRSIVYHGLNDFRWGTVSGRTKATMLMTKPLLPGDYEYWFKRTVDAFDKALTANESRKNPLPCFVMTHHAPSGKCISEMYATSSINCGFVSDLEWLIEKHPSIRCWAYGHVHACKEFKYVRKDGSEVLMLNNSRGYERCMEDADFDINLTVDTDTWEVERSVF